MLLQCHSVLQSTAPVLPCTTKYYSSTTLFYKLLQHTTPLLQSTIPVLLFTTTYSSSTTSVLQSSSVLLCFTNYYNILLHYYKVLFQYYTLLQRTLPVLPLYYKVQLQYYSVLQSSTHDWNVTYNARNNKRHPPTSPNTAPAMKNEFQDWSWSHMKRHLPCATQQKAASTFTKYCACHAKWISWLIRLTYETSFTMRGATRVSPQLHQILRLPRKMSLRIDPAHIW